MQSTRGSALDSSADELADPVASAEAAGLRYVTDEMPGIRRARRGDSFVYTSSTGAEVTHEKTLARIKSLAIPPAWTDVWICPSPRGHLQATGRDAKGRKQYRYHPKWRAVRDAVKYDRLISFAETLPRIRERVERDLARRGLPREKVLAAVVRLLEETRIRVGNEEYKKRNKSFGLTTLQDRHVEVNGSRLHFRFRGKHGITHDVELTDRRLARIVQRCRDIPGQELFQYIGDDGERHDVRSEDVNQYIREISGGEFTAKDFRTWAGTLLAAQFFRDCEPCTTETSKRDAKSRVVRVIELVAGELGNTVAVCRKCYVHPAVVDAYFSGALAQTSTMARVAPCANATEQPDTAPYALSPEEEAVVHLLRESEPGSATILVSPPAKQAA